MASEELKLRFARLYLARTYPAGDAGALAALIALANKTASQATERITITSGNFEGGGGAGEVTFERVILAVAIEERLAEIDPDYVAPAPRASGSLLLFSPGC